MALYVDIRKDFGDFCLQTKFETDGGVLGILGESGCGKSMTLKCIAGILTPDEGRIVLNDTVLFDSEKKINVKPQKRHVGFLFQNYALFPNMTVEQNLMTGLRAYEKDKQKARLRVREMMEKCYLTGLEKRRPDQLSGGQQQRCALARILISNPSVLMLDEPFSALDAFLRWKLELELAEILEEFDGDTLFVSHNRGEIYRLCTRACVMERGKAREPVPVKDLFQSPGSRAAAYLSGCQNFSAAHLSGAGQVYASDWGVMLSCPGAEHVSFSGIGVRSRFIRPATEEEIREGANVFACRILAVMEDVFEQIVMLRPEGKDTQIRMETEKKAWDAYGKKKSPGDSMYIRIEEQSIMLLKE